ncbi:hypothetical protein B0J15DRAFT_90992 [Fusarium solani]|uniref:Uncharacterized protein n=1 Tax=Fusarium solani TaxID=169388 RepID=A0A9P9GT43_FUSSL|nr:uncharacterized protein B0J15DRAFT_90992 [Fusarium solani]KAH7243969.1 hypothetical protein B0J15DRAFT_90992 [Fusarium solani]
MMEDGAISDVAPEASGTNLLPDWFPQRRVGDVCDHDSLDGARAAISLFRAAETTRRLGGRSLDYYLLILGSPVPVPLVMAQQPQKRGEPACLEG